MNELSISNKYSQDKYNLLGNTDVIASIPDIKSPVIQTVKLNPRPEKRRSVYSTALPISNTPDLYAFTKNGLKTCGWSSI